MQNKYTFENLLLAFTGVTTKLNGFDHFGFIEKYADNEFFNYELELNFLEAEREVRKFLIRKLDVKEIYVASEDTGLIKIPTRFASFEAMKITNLTMVNKKFEADVHDELAKHFKWLFEGIEQHQRREVIKKTFDECLNMLVCLNRVFHEGY